MTNGHGKPSIAQLAQAIEKLLFDSKLPPAECLGAVAMVDAVVKLRFASMVLQREEHMKAVADQQANGSAMAQILPIPHGDITPN